MSGYKEYKNHPGSHAYRPLNLTEEEMDKTWEEVMAMTEEEKMRIFEDPSPIQDQGSKKHTPSEPQS